MIFTPDGVCDHPPKIDNSTRNTIYSVDSMQGQADAFLPAMDLHEVPPAAGVRYTPTGCQGGVTSDPTPLQERS